MANNDHWTLDLKDLGMEGAGEELARIILTCQPPYAVCVQGKWGSGKTSLMRYAMARLGGEPLGTTVKTSKGPIKELPGWLVAPWNGLGEKSDGYIKDVFDRQCKFPGDASLTKARIVPIWFNPWQQQNADMPLVALLQELRAQFTYLIQFGRFAKRLAHVGSEAGLTILGDLEKIFSALPGLPKTSLVQSGTQAAREARKRDFEDLHDAQRLNLLFEQAVQRLLSPPTEKAFEGPQGKDGHPLALRRLVVFIDDLDRCSEEQTVRLLEAIKLYLQTQYCVFVFGMDGSAAQRAVRNVLPHKNSEEAQEYLEKLFQATIHVPIPSNYRLFVEGLLEATGLDASSGLEPADLAGRIVRLVEPNPRKLKNFVNTLAVGWSVRGSCGGPPIRFSLFLLLTFLRNYHPEAYRLLAYDPAHAKDLQDVLNEGIRQAEANKSSVYYFFRRTFRHAFPEAFPDNFAPGRKDEDEVVTELIARLDRHKGDSAFVDLWKQEFRDSRDDLVDQVRLVLQSDQGAIPGVDA